MAFYDDGSIYDDGTKYSDVDGVPLSFGVEHELHYHRISARINYTATTTPGSIEAFRIFELRLRVAPDSQQSFSHESFVDMTTPSQRIAAVLHHSGSNFTISNIQLIAQRKKHQPIG
jgi:hypothetical protein